MLPKIARVRVSAGALLVDLGITCVQRVKRRRFASYYQDIFAIVSHLNALRNPPNTHSRNFWQQAELTPPERRCAREIPRAHLLFVRLFASRQALLGIAEAGEPAIPRKRPA